MTKFEFVLLLMMNVDLLVKVAMFGALNELVKCVKKGGRQ